MEKKNIDISLFESFLKRNRVWKKFIANFEAYHSSWILDEFYKDRDSSDRWVRVLMGAFVWSTSPEGHKFWSKINKKWDRLCNKISPSIAV
jgi:hypothetical protein